MFHKGRIHSIKNADIGTPAELAEKLTQHYWTLCQGFRIGPPGRGLLFLNDATCEDGAAEFCVVRESDGAQVESLTVSWMKQEALAEDIRRYLADPEAMTNYGPGGARLVHPDGPCHFCA